MFRSSQQELAVLSSYHAATAFIMHSKNAEDEVLVLDQNLELFSKYFIEKNKKCFIFSGLQAQKYWLFLKLVRPCQISCWGYALSDILHITVKFSCRYGIPLKIILPSCIADNLYNCKEYTFKVLLQNWRSFFLYNIKKLKGWSIDIKTYNNYVYDCIRTEKAKSVKKYAELISDAQYSPLKYAAFANFVQKHYPEIIQNIKNGGRACIVIDEDLDMLKIRLGVKAVNFVRDLSLKLNYLNRSGITVHLKPTYYGDAYLCRHFRFSTIIPGEIPLQALDYLMPKGTIVTGWSATFLQERMFNMKAVAFDELINSLHKDIITT